METYMDILSAKLDALCDTSSATEDADATLLIDDASTISMERLLLNQFTRTLSSFRITDFGKKIVPRANIQLITNATLHYAADLLDLHTTQIYPTADLPEIRNERFATYHHAVMETLPVGSEWLPPKTNWIYRPASHLGKVRAFYTTTSAVRRIMSMSGVIHKSNVLIACDYSNITSAIIRPATRMAPYQKTMLVYGSMIHSMLQMMDMEPSRHHILQIPVSARTYTRMNIIRPIKNGITPSALGILDDPSFFIRLHLIMWLYAGLDGNKDTVPTTLFDHIPEEKRSHVWLEFTAGDNAVLYNLETLAQFRPTAMFWQKVLRHLNVLSMGMSEQELDQVPEEVLDRDIESREITATEPPTDTPVAEPTASESTPEETTTTAIAEPASTSPSAVVDAPASATPRSPTPVLKPVAARIDDRKPLTTHGTIADRALTDLAEQARDYIRRDPDRNQHVEKVDALIAQSLDAKYDGVSIADILRTQPPPLTTTKLDFLAGEMTDPGMIESTVAKFDEHYLEHHMDRHIAQTILSFARTGLFVKDIQTRKEITDLDRTKHYEVHFVDVDGKTHTVKFHIPIVDKRGVMLSRGVKSRMTKQNGGMPIYKETPTRVAMVSQYNKARVERVSKQAYRFDTFILRYIDYLVAQGVAKVTFGKSLPAVPVARDYTCVSQTYQRIVIGDYTLQFAYDERHAGLTKRDVVDAYEKQYGVYIGQSKTEIVFLAYNNVVTIVSLTTKATRQTTLYQLLVDVARQLSSTANVPGVPAEYTVLYYLSYDFPVVFALGYRDGLSTVLKRCPHRWYPVDGPKPVLSPTDIVIRFADGKLVFNRYPLPSSLILAGLKAYEKFLKSIPFADMDVPDTYFLLLNQMGTSTNLLKGLRAFFDMFVDPITYDVLARMGEPTNVTDLLYRATEMIADDHARPASSMENYRLRGYERIPAAIYYAVSRTMAQYQSRMFKRGTFSINPEMVYMEIMTDPASTILEDINPIQDIKAQNAITYGGHGGRTAQAFVRRDREYPADGVGILSEATPDSGKVGFNAYTTANPSIVNEYGMYDTTRDIQTMSPTQLLSATAVLVPGATQDDRSGLDSTLNTPRGEEFIGFTPMYYSVGSTPASLHLAG